MGAAAVGDITGLSAALAGLQPLDTDLTAIAALSTTSFGRGLLTLANAGATRNLLELGNSATRDVGTTAGTVAAGDDPRFGTGGDAILLPAAWTEVVDGESYVVFGGSRAATAIRTAVLIHNLGVEDFTLTASGTGGPIVITPGEAVQLSSIPQGGLYGLEVLERKTPALLEGGELVGPIIPQLLLESDTTTIPGLRHLFARVDSLTAPTRVKLGIGDGVNTAGILVSGATSVLFPVDNWTKVESGGTYIVLGNLDPAYIANSVKVNVTIAYLGIGQFELGDVTANNSIVFNSGEIKTFSTVENNPGAEYAFTETPVGAFVASQPNGVVDLISVLQFKRAPINSPVVYTTASAVVYTSSALNAGTITRDPNGASRTDTTASAANIIASLQLTENYMERDCLIVNTADAAETITLAGGAGVTIKGTITIGQNQATRIALTRTGASAVCIREI